MSPNGVVLFLLLAFVSLFTPTRYVYPVFGGALIVTFVVLQGWRATDIAFRKAAVLSAPLCLFLYLVWGLFVGSAPDTVLFVPRDTPLNAQQYVLGIASRVFLVVLSVTASTEVFSQFGSLAFIQALWAPLRVKALLLLTLSLKNTISIAATRSYTALVAANILTPRLSTRNLFSFWLLIQTVWVASLGIALERLDTKWKYERLPTVYALTNSKGPARPRWPDIFWITCAVIAITLTAISGLRR